MRRGTRHASPAGIMRSAFALLSCFVLLSRPAPAFATQTRPVPGARLRFETTSLEGRLAGTLVNWEEDTLLVSVDGYSPGLALIVPVDSLRQLEVMSERPLTLEGLGLGIVAGTVAALIASPDVLDENGDCTTIECIAYQVSPNLDTRIAVLGGVGALLGTIAGALTKVDTWVAVPFKRVQIGPTPDGGLALGMRISF